MSRHRRSSWRAFDPTAVVAAATVDVRILGLDPGSRRTGFGVIECRAGRLVPLAHGCFDVTEASPTTRLRLIFEQLGALLCTHSPSEVAIERIFVSRNADSALKLGQARGAALCAIPTGTPVFEYAPRAVKQAVVGSGAAEKFQVAQMVCALLSLDQRPNADAADALAVALCHAHLRAQQLLVQDAAQRWARA
jgi:crossover junction endodeoxyribonuclease RuvC